MTDETEYSLEDKLKWHGDINRYNIACGSYGDTQWEVWDDNGKHVEYEEHLTIVKIYQDEINRLKTLIRNDEECHY